jgi:DNA-binding CsgD family transcriptional regulator
MDVKGSPTSRPRIRDWEHANKYSLALQTGMPLGAYYRYCFRGETVCGMSRYQYELARRRAAGVPAAAAARELGLKPRTVRAAYARLKGRAVPDEAPAPSATEDTIGARLDPETYIKLQRMVAGCADP